MSCLLSIPIKSFIHRKGDVDDDDHYDGYMCLLFYIYVFSTSMLTGTSWKHPTVTDCDVQRGADKAVPTW